MGAEEVTMEIFSAFVSGIFFITILYDVNNRDCDGSTVVNTLIFVVSLWCALN